MSEEMTHDEPISETTDNRYKTQRDEKRKVPAGTVLIRTEQSLGALASYLLESQAEDG